VVLELERRERVGRCRWVRLLPLAGGTEEAHR
jgi:hypothetical protein